MTKGTLVFRIIISTLLGLCIVCTAFFSVLFVAYLEEKVVQEEYGIFVAGVPVASISVIARRAQGGCEYDKARYPLCGGRCV